MSGWWGGMDAGSTWARWTKARREMHPSEYGGGGGEEGEDNNLEKIIVSNNKV